MDVGTVSRFVLRHKAWVAGFWLAMVVVAVALMPTVFDRLSEDFSVPDTESNQAITELTGIYGNNGTSNPLVPVVTLPEGTTVESGGVRDELLAIESRVLEARPEARVVSYASTGDPAFVSEDGRTTFALVYLPVFGEGPAGLNALTETLDGATAGGADVLLSGRPLLSQETEEGGAGVLIETLIGGVGALVVLLYIFGSALALMPLIIAAVSILTSFLVIGGLTTVTDINFLVALIGLGVAIDYALLVVNRWRDERLDGHANETAVQRAMETAGHAVVFSGTTVGIGLVALIAVPIPFFRGIGIGGMVIPLASVAVTITLLPVILATIGPAMDRIRLRRPRRDDHQGWARWGAFVVRHRGASAIVGFALLALLVLPATQITIGEPRPDSLNGAGDAQAGLDAVEASGIGAGVMSPLTILVEGGPDEVDAAVSAVEGVRGAASPDSPAWRANANSLLVVVPQGDGGGESGRDLASRVRDAVSELPG
ncbi:MAG: MMPL family transporter, partial [Chloroflexia bacterium]|nr:MMPL family transporter [Chloroflexia bacterium]